jgi:hypothetical protein
LGPSKFALEERTFILLSDKESPTIDFGNELETVIGLQFDNDIQQKH